MAQSTKRSPSGLLSEAGKKSVRAVKKAVGKKSGSRKSAAGTFSEAARKAGRGVTDAARKAVGMRPTRMKKSGSR